MLFIVDKFSGGVGSYKEQLLESIESKFNLTKQLNSASIVHIHTPAEALNYFWKLFFYYRKRLIYTPHSYSTYFYKKKNFLSTLKYSLIEVYLYFFHMLFLFRCEKVICLTQYEFRVWSKLFPLFRAKFVVVPTAIKPNYKIKISKRRNLILWIGSFDDRKRPHYFLDFCIKFNKLIPNNDFKFLMCGNGPLFSDISEAAKKNDHLHNLEIKKNVSHELVLDYLTKAKFLVSFSVQEGLPMTFLEALEAGVPILTNEYSGGDVHEFLNNSNSFIFKDVDEFFEQIMSGNFDIFDEEICFKQPYSFENFINKHIEIYEGL